ncbi:DEAD/DEAH box helicase family protein [Promicromonospora alba]|uniref:DEAD/DEAH box helicase family protein n=1 Tax=Promicromonospora alba TaxID=1616110 RepID=A0ABV9HFS3_9MICO
MDEVLGPRPTATRKSRIPDTLQRRGTQAQSFSVSLEERLAIAVKAVADRGAALSGLAPSFAGSPSESFVRTLVDASQFSPIQAAALSAVMSGRDFIGHVPQGVDRQLAYAIPLLHQVVAPGEPGYDQVPDPGQPQAVVLVPTPSLAVAVAEHLALVGVSARRIVRIESVIQGLGPNQEATARALGSDVIVGTVEHLSSMIGQENPSLEHVHVVVLDGADEMASLGVLPDVEAFLGRTPAHKRTMLFTATMPDDVAALARRIMHLPLTSPARVSDPTADDKSEPTDKSDTSSPPARRTSKRDSSTA